jgi:hypothetical protein
VQVDVPSGAPFRQRWEAGIRYSSLHCNARLIALTLASLADWQTGQIPEDQMPGVPRLCKASALQEQAVRNSLKWLARLGWIERRDDVATYPKPIRLRFPASTGTSPRE